MMRCVRFQSDKRPHCNAREENVTNEKVDNDNSSQKHDERIIFNHSTPVTTRQNNVEESLEPDHYQSPILLPCTQEGGNEVAWDWHSSLKKTPESRNEGQNIHCETPKGTKLLHKKRNSDSPLLYKPLKRKTINMENIENIGQFAAELQALTKKMSVVKHTDQDDYSNNQVEKEVPILANTSYKEMSIIEDNKQNSIVEINDDHNKVIKKEINYDDLFNDSIDDDMIRCTQEIEEKLNSIAEKGNSIHSEPNIKKEELPQTSHTNNASNKDTVQSTSNENFKELLTENIFHKGTSNNNTLKTYSKLSLKRDSDSSIHIAGQTDKNLYKSYLSNNNMIHSSIRNPCEKKLSKNKITKSFDFPDDSFDDCLAACTEEEKSPTMFDSWVHKNDKMKSEASYGCLTHAPLKLEANSLKSTVKSEMSSTNLSTDKKFFKTKSLSDQYINQNAITYAKNNKANPMRPMLHLNSTKSSMITYTSVTRASVSTNPIVTNDCKVENSAISLTRGADRTDGSGDVNRCAIKGDGDRFIRHHSTGNMKNNTKEVSKTGSQPARCTPEEIERKRLQALMRLNAKKKLYAEMKITNNINR